MAEEIIYLFIITMAVAAGAAAAFLALRSERRTRNKNKSESMELIGRLAAISKDYAHISRDLTLGELQHEINKYEYYAHKEMKPDDIFSIMIKKEEEKIRKNGVGFTCEIGGIPAFSQLELISVFTNLLDNALEAAVRSGRPDAEVSLSSSADCICVENSKRTDEDPCSTGFHTAKEKGNHGNGVNILKKVLYREGYSIEYTDKGSIMIAEVKRS